ncbi:MAG: SUMF1/EgtB/PvdO family nonheme iron enzyme, partial [Magnetococcales bacterium]|nr:SUMF1/EgtB/PvdO family nonheme iron enzyme [Magnetococcales bacterium]
MNIISWCMAFVVCMWVGLTYAKVLDIDEVEKMDRSNPEVMVKTFVDLEFHGGRVMRYYFVIYTQKSRETQKNNKIFEDAEKYDNDSECCWPNDMYGVILDADFDDLNVVSRYNILYVKTDGNHGAAEIDYDRLASSVFSGHERRILADKNEHDLVRLELLKKGEQWYIVDPPVWRISVDAMHDTYKNMLESLFGFMKPVDITSSAYQRIDEYEILKYLKDESHKHSESDQQQWIEAGKALELERRRLEKEKRKWEEADKEMREAAERKAQEHPVSWILKMQGATLGEGQSQSKKKSPTWHDPVTGMEFVWVPGGTYWMGCGSWVPECYDDERPLHAVTLDGFWLGRYEITQGQWQAMM